jgi:multiple sugar transport system substrate-binding protein
MAKVAINGKLAVVQARDFYDAQNTFIENTIKSFAANQGYPIDHSYIEAYAGSGDVVQKLTAAVQASDGPDLLIHTLSPGQLHFLDIIDDVDDLEKSLEGFHGAAASAYQKTLVLDGKWYAVPNFSRSGGFFVRQDAFKKVGIDPMQDLGDFNALRDAALKVSQPDQSMWGWGMTANRSGDGDTTVRNAVFQWGGQVTDATGQVVVLGTEPYRQYAIDGLTWLKSVYTDPQYASMLPPGVDGWTDPSNNEAYLGGKVLLTNNAGTVFAQAVQDQNPVREDTYMILEPNGVGAGARVLMGAGGSMNFFIMKNAKNRDAAEQVIRYLMTPEIYKQLFQIGTAYVYPARQWGWNEPEIAESKYGQHVTPAYLKMFNDPSGWTGSASWPGPPSPQTDALENSNFWTDMWGEIVTGKAVPDAVDDAAKRAIQTFQQFGAKGA